MYGTIAGVGDWQSSILTFVTTMSVSMICVVPLYDCVELLISYSANRPTSYSCPSVHSPILAEAAAAYLQSIYAHARPARKLCSLCWDASSMSR